MACEQYIVNDIASTDYVDCVVTAVSGTLQSYDIYIRDEKSSGTGGGSSTSGFQTRTLNTKVLDETGNVTLSSNQFSLPSGTYIIEAYAPAGNSGHHKIKLRNVTDSSDTLIGLAEDGASPGRAWLFGKFTIASSKTFSIQHYCENGGGQLGTATGDGTIEIYTTVHLQKVG